MWYIYTMEYYSVIKKNEIMCDNMDGHGDYHTKWRKSDRERQIYDIACMWNLKKSDINCYKWTYLQNRNRHRLRKQTYG